MALRACTDCGQQVSDVAAACPGCGRPAVRSQNLRAVVMTAAVVLAVVIAYVLYLNVATG